MPEQSQTSSQIDPAFWAGRRVFVTGHTGFKGSWLCLMLERMGAAVAGYALDPPSDPSMYELAGIGANLEHHHGDVRDLAALSAAIRSHDPEIVIHMAAQALVRASYDDPAETFATNVMGTVNVLEGIRRLDNLQAVVVVTSDKCYDNKEWPWGYRENDPMGGHDPYSSSKGCAELVASAYRNSFFATGDNQVNVATARAGNVIGGGDWGTDRLVPDLMNAFRAGESALIRRPNAVRPWQHVLDPVAGYLILAERLCHPGRDYAGPWNFGPSRVNERPVRELVEIAAAIWGNGAGWTIDNDASPHEAHYLKLDVSKAHANLGWKTLMDLEQALELTVKWYLEWARGGDMRAMTLAQIDSFLGIENEAAR